MERRAELWTAGKGIATTLKAKSAEAAKRQTSKPWTLWEWVRPSADAVQGPWADAGGLLSLCPTAEAELGGGLCAAARAVQCVTCRGTGRPRVKRKEQAVLAAYSCALRARLPQELADTRNTNLLL